MTIHTIPVSSAVVFAYHNVGVRCLSVLLAQGVNVKLVVTHHDNPDESIWFESVKLLAEKAGIEVICPDNPNSPGIIEKIRRYKPDFFFSFYYRNMLGKELLGLPLKGAYNMHGSLLPAYRGRVPINWAIIHGEEKAGATLHKMELKPDAGAIVGQMAVPLLPNDTAQDLFIKVTCAAECVLSNVLSNLLEGKVKEVPMNLAEGAYFGGRKPEDGCINWALDAQDIHNLIRAVAPPYPGAFFNKGKNHWLLLGSYYRGEQAKHPIPVLYRESGAWYADCTNDKRFMITRLQLNGHDVDESLFEQAVGSQLILTEELAG